MMPRPTSDSDTTGLFQVAVQDGADALARVFRSWPLPFLRLCPLRIAAMPGLAAHRDRFEQADAVVFASSNGVRALGSAAADWRWPPVVVAQGPGTAAALAWIGRASIMPASPYDSEATIAMPEWSGRPGKVLRVSGESGRELFVETLRARGWEAEPLVVYRRVRVALSGRMRACWRGWRGRRLLVATSGEALKALHAGLGPDWTALGRTEIIVPSARIAAMAEAFGVPIVHRAASAARADVVSAVRDVLARG